MQKIDRKRAGRLWLLAALGVACFYSFLALRLAFHLPNLVQDDARQHVFWMQRFVDPTLFPNDLIADYFQAVAPAGYKAIYWIFAKIGVEPLLLSKILPAVIGIITGWLAFRLFVRLTEDARGAFFASVIICQLIWFKDDVVSATPRAFVYPFFLAFLLFLVERRVFFCLLFLTFEGLVYPQAALVSLGVLILRLVDWKDRYFLSRNRADYILAIGGIAALAIILGGFASSVSRYGPVITRTEAQMLPEFLSHGRSQFFAGGIGFWLTGARSGIWPGGIPAYLTVLGLAGIALLLFGRKGPAFSKLRGRGAILWQIAAAALIMWAAAHAFLFKLHLPARYSQWSLRLVIGMTAASAMMWIFAGLRSWCERASSSRRLPAGAIPGVLACLAIMLVIAPFFAGQFPSHTYYIHAKSPGLFEFLRTQPKNVVIAMLRDGGGDIPVFAHRSILVSAEHAIPYHNGYRRVLRERGRDLIRAHLTSNPDELRDFIDKYHVDLMIIPHQPLEAKNIRKLRWFREITSADDIAGWSVEGKQPALLEFVDRCKVWEGKRKIVLDANLIAQTIAAHGKSQSP